MSPYLQFLAALISYHIIQAVVIGTVSWLHAVIDRRRGAKWLATTTNFKPSRETR
jgi:hypothetical protein